MALYLQNFETRPSLNFSCASVCTVAPSGFKTHTRLLILCLILRWKKVVPALSVT
jgi:hypothetical protein